MTDDLATRPLPDTFELSMNGVSELLLTPLLASLGSCAVTGRGRAEWNTALLGVRTGE